MSDIDTHYDHLLEQQFIPLPKTMIEKTKTILDNYRIKIYWMWEEYTPSVDPRLYVLYAKYFADFVIESAWVYKELIQARNTYERAYKLDYDLMVELWEKTTPASDKAKSKHLELYLTRKEKEDLVKHYDSLKRWYQRDLTDLKNRLYQENWQQSIQLLAEREYEKNNLSDDPMCPF